MKDASPFHIEVLINFHSSHPKQSVSVTYFILIYDVIYATAPLKKEGCTLPHWCTLPHPTLFKSCGHVLDH